MRNEKGSIADTFVAEGCDIEQLPIRGTDNRVRGKLLFKIVAVPDLLVGHPSPDSGGTEMLSDPPVHIGVALAHFGTVPIFEEHFPKFWNRIGVTQPTTNRLFIIRSGWHSTRLVLKGMFRVI